MSDAAVAGNGRLAEASSVWSGLLERLPNWVLGLWLLVIYCLLLTYTVFAFSAYQMHISLESAKENGGALSVDELIDKNNELRSVQDLLYENYSDRDAASARKLAKIQVRNDYEQEKSNIFATCRSRIAENKRARDPDYAGATEFCQRDNPDALEGTIKQIIDEELERVKRVDLAIAAVDADIARIQADLDVTESSIKSNLDRESTVTGGWTPQMRNLIVKLNYFQSAGYEGPLSFLLPDFINISEDVLALIIVLSMGAIGGALHITRNFLAPENADDVDTYLVRYRYIFFQPFLGAFTAFAVYIFVRAGVIVMSNSSAGVTTMSPFFIAFLGIVSGFLANVALDVIESTGKALFRAQSDKARARWAYGLKAALTDCAKIRTQKPDIAPEDLTDEIGLISTALQLDPKKVTAWMDLKETVPGNYQRYIAIYLKMHPRQIFTDVPESDEAGAV